MAAPAGGGVQDQGAKGRNERRPRALASSAAQGLEVAMGRGASHAVTMARGGAKGKGAGGPAPF